MSESLYLKSARYDGVAKADPREASHAQPATESRRTFAQPATLRPGQGLGPGFDKESGTPEKTAVAGFRRTATRADLLDAVYSSCPSLSRNQARDIFEMALEEVSGALTRGESVKLRAFGLFSVREKRERIGRNPRTGEEVPIKPRRVLTFKASPVLLDHVNGREPGIGAKEDH